MLQIVKPNANIFEILGVSPRFMRHVGARHNESMYLTLLGGAASARFAHGLVAALGSDDHLTIVHPTSRDMWVHGLKHAPDANAFLSAGAATYSVTDAIDELGLGPAWFRPSDQDTALDLVRTELLQADFTLAETAAAIAVRKKLNAGLIPMSNDRIEQHVVVDSPEGARAIHVEEYLAEPDRHAPHDVVLIAEEWSVCAEAAEAIEASDVLILGPDSMTLALMPIFRTPGLVEAVAASTAPVIDTRGADYAPAALIEVAPKTELKFDRVTVLPADPAITLTAVRSFV